MGMKNNQYKLQLNAKIGGLTFSALILSFTLISFIVSTIVSTFAQKDGVIYYAINSLTSPLTILIVMLVLSKASGESVKKLASLNKFKPIYLPVSIFAGVGVFCAFGFLNQLFAEVLIGWGYSATAISLPLNDFGALILFIVTYAVLPAVMEECFFRGALLNSFSKIGVVALAAVAAAFALYHGSLTQLIYQFIYGAALVAIAARTGSSIPCMIAHFLNNFAIILFEYTGVFIDLLSPIVIIIGVVAIVIAVGLSFIEKEKGKLSIKGQANEVKGFFIPFGIFGIVVCLLSACSMFFVGAL